MSEMLQKNIIMKERLGTEGEKKIRLGYWAEYIFTLSVFLLHFQTLCEQPLNTIQDCSSMTKQSDGLLRYFRNQVPTMVSAFIFIIPPYLHHFIITAWSCWAAFPEFLFSSSLIQTQPVFSYTHIFTAGWLHYTFLLSFIVALTFYALLTYVVKY